ncbi:MAG: triose-phosphate isomerase [Comamonadaceae bacterium]|nr:triose-phosphate isomerase [Comamonadaceae bacterium]
MPFVYLPRDRGRRWPAATSRWGAQDVSAHEQGAYTGEVSAAMLRRVRLPLRHRRPLRAPRATTPRATQLVARQGAGARWRAA